MNEIWAHIKTFLLNKGLDIAGAAVVLVVGLWAIKLLTRLVSKSKGFRKADPGAAGFLLSFATVALKLVLFLTVISMLGIPVVNFVTILATAGAAVGLAMQGSLSNLVGGVMLLFFKPFNSMQPSFYMAEVFHEFQQFSGSLDAEFCMLVEQIEEFLFFRH